ncbi:MAG: hypothetical protein WC058_05050 [Phycisphaeraceae bacterium]
MENLLIDTNIFVELLLQQDRAAEVRTFFAQMDLAALNVTDFSIHSVQSLAAELFDLRVVSFDADFDRAPRGRKTTAQILADLRPRRGFVPGDRCICDATVQHVPASRAA